MCRFLLFLISVAHFSMPNSIPMSWLNILTASIRVSNSFSFLANSLISMYIRWVIFSCYLLSLYPLVHFRSMWLSGVSAVTNNNGDSASPWNITLWIFAKLFPPAVNFTLQVSIDFSIKFILPSIPYLLRQFIIHLCETLLCAFSS